MLETEMQRALRKGAGRKKTIGVAFREWLAAWRDSLTLEEREVWTLIQEQRAAEVHKKGAETVADKTERVPLRPPRSGHPAYYNTSMMAGPPPIFGDAWHEEKRRLGLPPWADMWREAFVHDFKIGDERVSVVGTCERHVCPYLTDLSQTPEPLATPRGCK
jgi:hypothetical protein